MKKSEVFEKLAANPLALEGYNGSGVPIGEDDGFEKMVADENFKGKHDPLVAIDPEKHGVLLRNMYFDKGWTQVKAMFLREPALRLVGAWSRRLEEVAGWKLRLTDTTRAPETNLKGMEYSVKRVLASSTRVTYEEFTAMMMRELPFDIQVDGHSVELINRVCAEANNLFCATDLKPFVRPEFSTALTDLSITIAGNLGLDPSLQIDRYAIGTHVTGGIIDKENVEVDTGRLVNMGVPVDEEGLASVLDFFEPDVGTFMRARLVKRGRTDLNNYEARMKHYRSMIEAPARDDLRAYLEACGVDVREMLGSRTYFDQIWNQIMVNRRVDVAVAREFGVEYHGGELWHVDLHDALGGVRSQRLGVISGGPSLAIYRGQKQCAWGNAMPLYDKLVAAQK